MIGLWYVDFDVGLLVVLQLCMDDMYMGNEVVRGFRK